MFSTDRLTLRKVKISDGDFLHTLDNDPDVMKYINGGLETPREFISNEIVPVFTQYNSEKVGIGYWIVELNGGGAPMGWCCLRESTDSIQTGSVGFRFLPKYWGKGYATEAASVLIRYGFDECGFSTIKATTYEFNAGSRRTLEKLGFTESRKFRADLSEQVTAYFGSTDPWSGWDMEYNLEVDHWGSLQEK